MRLRLVNMGWRSEVYRYIILAIYPLLVVSCIWGAYQTRRISRTWPSTAWTLKRRVTLAFMVFQVYGAVRIATAHRVFTWADPIYLIGLLAFFAGMNKFNYLLLKDAKAIRLKALRVLVPLPPASGDLPPEHWEKVFTQIVRQNIKPEYLTEVEIVTE